MPKEMNFRLDAVTLSGLFAVGLAAVAVTFIFQNDGASKIITMYSATMAGYFVRLNHELLEKRGRPRI